MDEIIYLHLVLRLIHVCKSASGNNSKGGQLQPGMFVT